MDVTIVWSDSDCTYVETLSVVRADEAESVARSIHANIISAWQAEHFIQNGALDLRKKGGDSNA
jgi:hypothetical protein